jgi:predicted membrane channel-forming protein YqfA (hemolysin III family)
MASAFPVLIGAAFSNRAVFQRLYAALPVIMLVELAVAIGTAVLAVVDVGAYYVVSMFVLGVFSSSVVYLLQKMKEVRYRRNRAAFDRRVDMADGCGLVAGSALSVVGFSLFRDPLAVALLGVAQTAVVYGLFLLLYRAVPARRKGRADEEAHPWQNPCTLMIAA